MDGVLKRQTSNQNDFLATIPRMEFGTEGEYLQRLEHFHENKCSFFTLLHLYFSIHLDSNDSIR